MKKSILILLCCTMFICTVSCNKSDDINQTEITTIQITLSNQTVYSNSNVPKDLFFLNYDDILNRYRDLLSNTYNETNDQISDENDRTIDDALQSVVINSNTARMGYSLYDINEDGKTELFLLDEQYHIYAAFSQMNETPILLDVFAINNNYVSLDKNGLFYKTGYGKGENSYTKIMQISDNGKFEILLEYGCYDDGINHEYYVIENNVKSIIALQDIIVLQERYGTFLQNPSITTQNSGILFVPIIEK